MIRTAALAVILFALPAAPALAQAPQAPVSQLALTGQGEVSLVPDQASISAGVLAQSDSAGDAIRANARAMSAVFDALERAGVEDRDIQTSQLSVSPVYEQVRTGLSPNTQRRIVGYEARNAVTVQLDDIDAVGSTIDALFEAGANTLNGLTFSSSRADEARDEARRLAVQDLFARRDLYAEAAGFEVTRLLSLNEGGVARPFPETITVSGSRVGFMDAAPTQIAAGELTVRASVSAVWEIEG